MKYELIPGLNRQHNTVIDYAGNHSTRIEVFWKDLRRAKELVAEIERGVGPVVSVVLADHELLRFDCLGDCGHYHAAMMRENPDGEIRLWFREQSVPEQIERVHFELTRNLAYYQGRSPIKAVRELRLDPHVHAQRCDQAKAIALDLWTKLGSVD